ncbi:MAG: GTPase [Dehalococcoidia bacterium]
MPANLPIAYYEAEKRFRSAETAEEKVEALEEMLAVMPKHKGTDGLRADIRAKISKFSKEASKAKATAKKGGVYNIPREGAGQVVIVGTPNAGKSQITSGLTATPSEVAHYPFTTQMPHLGMMDFENVQVQLIDMPPITEESARPWFATLLRSADSLILVVDLSTDPAEQMEQIIAKMEEFRVGLPGTDNRSEKSLYTKHGLIIGNKSDLDSSGTGFKALKDKYGKETKVLSISAQNGGDDELRREIFNTLNVIRVYTKEPGKKADISDPMVMWKRSTVEDAAEAVHKDFRRGLRYALIWGSGKFDGQRIKRDHVLQDGDILELHT